MANLSGSMDQYFAECLTMFSKQADFKQQRRYVHALKVTFNNFPFNFCYVNKFLDESAVLLSIKA